VPIVELALALGVLDALELGLGLDELELELDELLLQAATASTASAPRV
jgi:hypothetical protein